MDKELIILAIYVNVGRSSSNQQVKEHMYQLIDSYQDIYI